MNEFEFELPNFEKYNPRKDIKSTSWFRASNTTFFDAKFLRLGTHSKLLWFYYLAEISRNAGKPVRTAINVVAHNCKIRTDFAQIATLELEANQMLKITWRDADVSVRTRRNRTNETGRTLPEPLTNVHKTDTIETSTSQIAAKTKPKSESKTGATWEAFSNAYRKRYGSDPVRNATTNSQMSNFLKRIGEEEAPKVAEFYLSLKEQFYLNQCHSVGILLRDCEKLRTMWNAGIRTTKVDQKTAYYQEQMTAIERGEL